jgi:hypothetical protein
MYCQSWMGIQQHIFVHHVTRCDFDNALPFGCAICFVNFLEKNTQNKLSGKGKETLILK